VSGSTVVDSVLDGSEVNADLVLWKDDNNDKEV
jgi:hypothetical protein